MLLTRDTKLVIAVPKCIPTKFVNAVIPKLPTKIQMCKIKHSEDIDEKNRHIYIFANT